MKIKKISPAATCRPFPLLIKSMLAYSLVLNPEREIVYRDLVRFDYFELNRRVRRLANLLQDLGLEGGETVGVMDYDSHRYLEGYFGIPMTGNILHTINWRLSPAQILFTINHAEDKVLFVHEDFLPLLEKFSGEMPTVKKVIFLTDKGKKEDNSQALSPTVHSDGEYETLLAEQADTYSFPDFDEDAVATTFYTTGTTGDPKGVYFTHRQLVLHTMSLASTLGFVDGASCRLTTNDVYMPLTPMFHVHAWGFPFLATQYSMKQVYAGKMDPVLIARLYHQEKVTISHCVPTILQMVLKCPEAATMDLSGWKIIIGGAAFPKMLAKAALERGMDVMAGYGMSETCPVIATTIIRREDKDKDLEWQVDARTRTGVPVAFVEIKLITPEGKEALADDKEQGEIVLRTPWLTEGYVKEPGKGADLWEGGYLHTGDVATIDPVYSIRIADRIKDVIKSGGEWVSSIDLENLIGLYGGVAEAAVVGMADPKWGERPYALVVARPGQILSVIEIKKHIQQYINSGHISKWAMPEQIELVDSIPKTSVGKIDKKKIRERINVV
ncbi:fatty acid--CoA ligase [Flavitalea flava]